MEHIVIFITASNAEEAQKIGAALLDEKLVACVNSIPKVHSCYWWQGSLECSDEVLLIAKTVRPLLETIITKTKKLHSYKVPEIIALPIIGGNPDYLEWIDDSVRLKQ
jgi:periplasmic divalent cation tolerance protein